MNLTDADRAWLAGIFEGEGCFSIEKNGGVRATVNMTDRDVVQRIDALFPSKHGVIACAAPGPKHKQQYRWRINGPSVCEFIEMVMPWLGERRSARAREVLASVAARRPRSETNANAQKTQCPHGHAYSPENTVFGDVRR